MNLENYDLAKHVAGAAGHLMVGCLSSAASGDSCKAGAIGAGLSMLATPMIEGIGSNDLVKAGAASIVGFALCRRSGEIGRRRGLKIPRGKTRAGSIPASGTSVSFHLPSTACSGTV